jgi:hypothetical protein
LPSGSDAAQLRRLGAEIEMWLHAAAFNTIRERNRRPRVSGLWLWGGGSVEANVDGARPAELVAGGRQLRLVGTDPFLAAIHRELSPSGIHGAALDAAPRSFDDCAPESADLVVELTPMSGMTLDALHSLEANWFAPARAALERRALSEFVLVANDRCFTTTRGAGWKFWRSRSSWLARLAA